MPYLPENTSPRNLLAFLKCLELRYPWQIMMGENSMLLLGDFKSMFVDKAAVQQQQIKIRRCHTVAFGSTGHWPLLNHLNKHVTTLKILNKPTSCHKQGGKVTDMCQDEFKSCENDLIGHYACSQTQGRINN